MSGLNSEEIKIIRRSKEEEHRKGGWVKIFPTADTWEIYSPFLQFNTTHNLMLHQRLYPERHKGSLGKLTTTGVTSVGSRSRTGYLQVTGSNSKGDIEHQQRNVEAYAHAVIRTKQYERRLGQKRRKNKRKSRATNRKGSKSKLVQGVAEDMEEDQVSEDECSANQRTEQPLPAPSKVEDDVKVIEVNTAPEKEPEEKVEAVTEKPPVHPAPHPAEPDSEKVDAEEKVDEPEPEPEPKYNVVELLTKGGSLSKVQARSAFAMYLVRVQQRLISESGALSQDDVEALNEQMDLVLRFLKRAAVNLQQPFKVIVPSRKLPLTDRRRILAKQLGDFVHIYNKETDQLRSRRMIDRKHLRRSESMEGLNESKFEKFVNTACEAELEEVLTTYTKLNKSASIFLGSKSKSSDYQSTLGAGSAGMRSDSALAKRKDSSDLHDGMSQWEDVPRVRSASNADIRYDSGGSHSLPRPASAHPPPSSYNNAVSIYSQKLTRPRSAIISNQKTGSRPTYARPTSATNHSRPSSATTYTTAEPTVDTYNEQAIHEALQRLAVRQQNRQYSAMNGTSALGSTISTSQPLHLTNPSRSRPGSASLPYSRQRSDATVNPDSAGYSSGGRRTETVHPLQKYMEDRSQPSSASGQNRTVTDSKMSSKPQQTNVNLQNANDTFNNFIEDPTTQWQSDLMTAYSQVTGVQPQNYHNASAGSRQFHLAQQQQAMKQQRLMEQSKALLEQSKAKHQAMVAQAHAAQRTLNYARPVEVQAGKQTFTPKPPIQPAGGKKMTPAHRLARTAMANDESNLNFNFYNSLKYDIHTGQTQSRSGDGW